MSNGQQETFEQMKARVAAQKAADEARLAALRAEGEAAEAAKRKAAADLQAAKGAALKAAQEAKLKAEYQAAWLAAGGNVADFQAAWPELRAGHTKREVEKDRGEAEERLRRMARDF